MAVAPANFASARSNTVGITINVGDEVLVMVVNQDGTQPVGFTDNSAGSANVYGLTAQFATGAGYVQVWLCLKALASATSVSFTAGHVPSIAAATFTGAYGARLITSGSATSGGGASFSVAGSTIYAGSYNLLLGAFGLAGTAFTAGPATSGVLQTTVPSTAVPVDGVLAITITAPTVGSYTTAATMSAAGYAYDYFLFEIFLPFKYDNYLGKIPPKMDVPIRYEMVPLLAGGGGGPVTPVPVAVVLHDGTVGQTYTETITAQGGSGTGYTYALVAGSLPTGTTLTGATGVISGITSAAGTFAFTIKVTDSLGNTGTQNFSITVSIGSGTFGWTG